MVLQRFELFQRKAPYKYLLLLSFVQDFDALFSHQYVVLTFRYQRQFCCAAIRSEHENNGCGIFYLRYGIFELGMIGDVALDKLPLTVSCELFRNFLLVTVLR